MQFLGHALIAAALVLVAVSHPEPRVVEREVAPPVTSAGHLAPGHRVVGRWQNGFYEGTVIDVRGELVTVAWDSGSPDHSHLPRGWVASLESRLTRMSAEPWSLCGRDGSWQLCRTTGSEVELLDGARHGAGSVDVIPVPLSVRAWAFRYADRTLRENQRRAAIAGLVPATAGKPVEGGQVVLARWSDGNWWRARVAAVDSDRVTVRWSDGTAMELDRDDVAPLKTGGLDAGAFAICDWQGGTRWWRATIDAVAGERLTVHYIDETISDVAPDSCVAAVPRPAR